MGLVEGYYIHSHWSPQTQTASGGHPAQVNGGSFVCLTFALTGGSILGSQSCGFISHIVVLWL